MGAREDVAAGRRDGGSDRDTAGGMRRRVGERGRLAAGAGEGTADRGTRAGRDIDRARHAGRVAVGQGDTVLEANEKNLNE